MLNFKFPVLANLPHYYYRLQWLKEENSFWYLEIHGERFCCCSLWFWEGIVSKQYSQYPKFLLTSRYPCLRMTNLLCVLLYLTAQHSDTSFSALYCNVFKSLLPGPDVIFGYKILRCCPYLPHKDIPSNTVPLAHAGATVGSWCHCSAA